MELYLDTADAQAVAELSETLTIAGVTTNPTIVTSSGKTPEQVFEEMNAVISPDQRMFMQVVADKDLGKIMDDAERIVSLRENMYVKIPVTPIGLKAIKEAKKRGMGVLATAIYSADEAFLAAMNGADYLAPYVNRMENLGDGIGQVRDLIRMLEVHGLESKVIAASFKNTRQVHELILAGAQSLTIPVDVAWNLVNHPSTQIAVDEFSAAWVKAYGRSSFSA